MWCWYVMISWPFNVARVRRSSSIRLWVTFFRYNIGWMADVTRMRRSSSLATRLWVISLFSRSHNTSQQMTGNSVQLDYACRHDAHKNHHGNSVIGMFSQWYASFELQIQPTVRTNYIVIYYDLTPQTVAQARPSQSRAVIDGFGLAWRFWKPKPLKARPKPWLSGQAGPEHH